MDKFKPRKVVVDDNLDKTAGRSDAYGSMGSSNQYEVDRYVDRRDKIVDDLGQAEKDIDIVIKRNIGKTKDTPSVVISGPDDDTVEFGV